MTNQASASVDSFLDGLAHARKAEVQHLRAAILASDVDLTEQVKWKAPSFCSGGDDRVTFRLQPGDRVELVFHRGAKVRADVDTFEFHDPTGLMRWSTPDRGVVVLADAADTALKTAAVVALVEAWIAATTP